MKSSQLITVTADDSAHQLAERLKEIQCLYGLLELAQKGMLNLDAFLNEAVALLPPAFQFPSELNAHIQYEGRDYFSGTSSPIGMSLMTSICIQNEVVGSVKVGYRGDLAPVENALFLPDEVRLLDAYTFELVQILERRRVEEELRLLASVFENSYAGIMISNANNKILKVNPAFSQTTGYSAEEALGKNPRFLSSQRQSEQFYKQMWRELHRRDFWRGEVWNRRKDGEVYAEILSVSLVRNERGEVKYYIGVFSDISLVKENEAELIHLAHYDALTGLPNRRLLRDRLDQGLAQIKRKTQRLAVCFLDLDAFKPINDQYGHEAGDVVLVEVTRRLQSALRQSDTLARLGGDEFVLLLLDIENHRCVEQLLQRILALVEQPIPLAENLEVSVSVSIGVVIYPQADLEGDNLIQLADQMMYQAKQSVAPRICFWPEAQQAAECCSS